MKKGFTLIELLVVISIISFLSSIILGSLNQARAKARDSRRIQDVKALQLALEGYLAEYGTVPQCGNNASNWCYGCSKGLYDENGYSLLSVLVDKNFISKIPIDPKPDYSSANRCINYEYFSSDSTRSSSGWRCGGQVVDYYEYAIRFATEATILSTSSFPIFNSNTNNMIPRTPAGGEYCILGPLKK